MEEKPATNESGGTPSRTQNSPVTSLSENPIDATLQSTETETGKKEIKNGEKEIPVLTFLLTKIREWRSSRPKREPARFTDHLIGWSTFVMTLTTIGIGIIACLQYRELQISGEQTDQLITIQKKIANLQYLAGSPNVHLHHFNLYHTGDNGRIYGYIRVQNDGTRYQAPSLRIAANLGFRPFPPNSKDDYLFGEKDFVEASPSPLH